MERLTKRLEDGQAVFHECHGTCCTCDGVNCYCIGPMVDRLSAYEDTGMEPDEIKDSIGWMSPVCVQCDGKTSDGVRTEKCGYPDNITKCLEQSKHLFELAQAEQAGRLVEIPCNVGDTVWVVFSNGLRPYVVDRLYVMADSKVMVRMRHMLTEILRVSEDNFGKTVFLTQKEAEMALKGEHDG